MKYSNAALGLVYKKLYSFFGPQHWWPADTPFEIMVGAILTQNTNWSNVEKAINNLKKHRALNLRKLYRLPLKKLTELIAPCGYYNIKAKRLKNLLDFFVRSYRGSIQRISAAHPRKLRQELLGVNGVGPETADSILLYALNKPVFVVDAYTKRILFRHKFISADTSYQKVQDLFMQNLKGKGVKLFNEYHALLVRLGKEYCLKKKPKCRICPLKEEKL